MSERVSLSVSQSVSELTYNSDQSVQVRSTPVIIPHEQRYFTNLNLCTRNGKIVYYKYGVIQLYLIDKFESDITTNHTHIFRSVSNLANVSSNSAHLSIVA